MADTVPQGPSPTSRDSSGTGSPGAVPDLIGYGFPNIGKYGVPTMNKFIPDTAQEAERKQKEEESRHKDVRMIYRDLVGKGIHPKDAAKQAQAMTGHSVVTGQPIRRDIKISKKPDHHVVYGQYGVTGKSKKAIVGSYA